MAPPLTSLWNFSQTATVISFPQHSFCPAPKFVWKRMERVTGRLSTSFDHLNYLRVSCGYAYSIAALTSVATVASHSSGSILLHDLGGNSTSSVIIGNVLENFEAISQQRQEVCEENGGGQLNVVLPIGNRQHLCEFDPYLKDLHSHFDSRQSLVPLSEQLQECLLPPVGSQKLVQPLCTEAILTGERATENQDARTATAVADALALAKAAVQAARDAAALAEAQALAEVDGLDGFFYETALSHSSRAGIDKIWRFAFVDILGNSQITERGLTGEGNSKLDEYQGQTGMKENITARSKRGMERKAKRERVRQKAKEVASGIASSPVRRKAKRPVIGSYDPKNSLSSVLRDSTCTTLLTASEEAELSQRVQDLLKLERVKAGLQAQFGREPTSVEWAKALGLNQKSLESRLREGRKCRDKMINSNLRLVISVAKHYQGRGMTLQDLIQEGSIGLMKGVEKFDYKKGYKFSTYAHWWIRQAVTRAVSEHSKIIRFPVHIYEILSRICEAKRLLYQEHGRKPKDEEIAELVGLTVKKLKLIINSTRTPKSLDQPAGRDQERTFGEIVADADAKSPESEITKRLMKRDLDKLLRILTPRERNIIRLRYGLDGGGMRTLEEIGKVYNVSRERIRQIESKALRKLKQPNKNRFLRYYVDV